MKPLLKVGRPAGGKVKPVVADSSRPASRRLAASKAVKSALKPEMEWIKLKIGAKDAEQIRGLATLEFRSFDQLLYVIRRGLGVAKGFERANTHEQRADRYRRVAGANKAPTVPYLDHCGRSAYLQPSEENETVKTAAWKQKQLVLGASDRAPRNERQGESRVVLTDSVEPEPY